MTSINRSILFMFYYALMSVPAIAQVGQTVTGSVFDEASKAPLPGVTIVLQEQVATGAATDSTGYFKINNVPLGRHSFKISYIGYEERTINDVIITAGKEVNLNIGMQESLHKLDEVAIVYNKAKDKTRTNNDMAQVSARSFNVDETKRYAGALGDPSRMAANFAGVVSGNDANNDIVIRGNSPMGMLWQLNGLNIPNPNHYGSFASTGGPISMLNNNNIDKSDFLTSAFPAQYGNAVSGVFDIQLRDGNRDKHEFMAQMGFNGFELGAEGPIGRNKQSSYLINYRYSTLGLFQKLGINFGTGNITPYYQDLNYKFTTRINKRSKLSLYGIAGGSHITFLGKDVDTSSTELFGGDPYANEMSRYMTTITGLTYDYQLSEKTATSLTLGYSTTSEKIKDDSISDIDAAVLPREQIKVTTNKMSAVWTVLHKINARNNLQGGITYDLNGYSMLDKEYIKGETEHSKMNKTGNFGLLQSYLQWKHRFNDNLSAVGGLHFQHLSITNDVALEPRMSLRYALSAHHAISIGYGLHHQAQNIYSYSIQTYTPNGIVYTNKDLGFTQSQHFVATYDWNATRNLRIKAELYYQYLNKVPVELMPSSFSALNTGADFGIPDKDSLVNKGTGRNYGAELTVERFFNKGFYFLVTGSLFQSRYTGSDGVERNTAFNTGYVLNVLAGKEFRLGKKGSVFAVNLKGCTVGGRYLTPVDFAASQAAGENVYREDLAYTEKQSPYLRADLKLAYRKEFRKSTFEIAVDLQNISNHQNVFQQYYDRRTNKIVKTYQQGFFPVPMLRYTF
ncbi:MAG: hypothetical protein BGO69_18535 [Bacteroidetes bacterium 46-16]|nr:MAG: hypothetical protein BGO69_18535 [Bacteroidetes bacterium 46-16]